MNNTSMLLLLIILSVSISHIKSKPYNEDKAQEKLVAEGLNSIQIDDGLSETFENNAMEENNYDSNIDEDFLEDSENEPSENATVLNKKKTRLFFQETLEDLTSENATELNNNKSRIYFPNSLDGFKSFFSIGGQNPVIPQSNGQGPFGAINPHLHSHPHPQQHHHPQLGGSYPGGPFNINHGNPRPLFPSGPQNSGCLEWCRTGYQHDRFYCCPGKEVNNLNSASFRPVCPPPRSTCTNVFRSNPPVPCTYDYQCIGQPRPSKCCQDVCLKQYVCKPGLVPERLPFGQPFNDFFGNRVPSNYG